MGNDLTNDEEKEKKEDFENEFIKYGIINKNTKNNSYIISPKIAYKKKEIIYEFSLLAIFEGHNSDIVSNYLLNNLQKNFEKLIVYIDEDDDENENEKENNYSKKIKEIFKSIDKELKKKLEQENEIDIIAKKDEKNYIKNSIQNSMDIPDEFKEINDEEINDLLNFKNLFNNSNNNSNNLNYVGASASIILIIRDKIILSQLGLTQIFLFDKEGNILNFDNKNIKEHKFNNEEEKKRIKLFNKNIDYESLNINYHIPSSRNFGFFKYKENILLKEENQIISCVPDVTIFNKKDVDFIFMTSGFDINLFDIKKFSSQIKKIRNEPKIKYSDIIKEMINIYLKDKKDIKEEKKSNKQMYHPFFGKDNYGDEDIIINDLDNEYYYDVMDMNKKNKNNNNMNITWILAKFNEDNITSENKEEVKEVNEIKENKNDISEIKEGKKEEFIEENKLG